MPVDGSFVALRNAETAVPFARRRFRFIHPFPVFTMLIAIFPFLSFDRRFVVGSVLILFLVSCASQPEPRPRKEREPIPAWFTEAGSPNDGFLYGIGSHPSLQSAKDKALRDVASKIQVSIESTTESVSSKFGSSVSQSYNEVIQSKVANIQFQNPQVINQAVANNVNYVKLRVSIDSIVKLTLQELDNAERELKGIEEIASSDDSKLHRLFRYKTYEPALDNGISLALRLRSLGNLNPFPIEYPYDAKLDEFSGHRRAMSGILSELVLQIEFPEYLRSVAVALSEALNAQNVNASVNPLDRYDGRLILDGELIEDKIYGDFVVNADVALAVADDESKILSNNVVKLKAFSKKDHRDAAVLLGIPMKKRIAREGVLNVLNIN